MTHSSSKAPDDSLSESASQHTSDGVADFTHQLGTALTVIRGQAQLLRRRARRQDGDDAKALERSSMAIDSAVQRIIDALEEREESHLNDQTGGDDTR